MLTIGEFAKATGLTNRAIRVYEEKGLLRPSYRGENGYRFFHQDKVQVALRILQFKKLGFSLDQIRTILRSSNNELEHNLNAKLSQINTELDLLSTQKKELEKLLYVNQKINTGHNLSDSERRIFMEAIQNYVIESIKKRKGSINQAHFDYLERDKGIYDTDQKREFIDALKSCIEFARSRKLLLGPGRGHSASSIVMYALGFSEIDPTAHALLPERLLKESVDIHIDVEYDRGQEFVDFCREISKKLKFGQINAFKMPLLNIIENTQKLVGEINYDEIDDETLLRSLRTGDIDKIFCLDLSEDALVMKYENHLPGFNSKAELIKYIKDQEIKDFNDLLNIISLWRPNDIEKIKRCHEYKKAKEEGFEYTFLSPSLKNHLNKNYGRIIYHDDIIRIVKEYTNWSLDKSSIFRRDCFKKEVTQEQLNEFKSLVPSEVFELVLTEAPYTFCRSHILSFSKLIRKTLVLKELHKDIYLNEISKWELKNGYKWDDIGIKLRGISLLQS